MIYKKHLKKFVKLLNAKMLKGFKVYGDESFKRNPKDLIGELQQEVIDISGWGLILYCRLEEMKKKI